jgi:hypothetical protein
MSVYTFKKVNIFSLYDEIHEKIPIITKSPKFSKFIDSLDKTNLDITALKIHNVKWCCDPDNPTPDKLGFIYMELIATDKRTNEPISEIILLKGETIAIYIRIIFNGKKYVLLTKQLRVPIGFDTLEIPSGMIDPQNKNFIGIALQEIGINPPNESNLISLGDFYSNSENCDECIKLYYFEVEIDQDQFNKIQEENYENESVKILLVPEENYENELKTMKDAKTIIAHHYAKGKNLL